MPKPNYSYLTRKKALADFSDATVSLRQIQNAHNVNYNTVKLWAKEVNITRGERLPDEELEDRIEAWGQKFRDMPEEEGTSPQKRRVKAANLRYRFGATKEHKRKSLATFKSLGDPDEYGATIQDHFDGVVDQLSREVTPEGQVNAMTSGLLLVQLKGMIDNPPPVQTWADAERVIKLLRLTLGMDDKKSAPVNGIDLRIVNAKVDRRKIIEAEIPKSA